MNVLVVNAGSSSLKLRVLGEDDAVLAETTVERWSGGDETGPLQDFLGDAPAVDVVGHRVVHGGSAFTGATVIDDDVRAGVEALTGLAPLHQPRALAGIDAARRLLPGLPQVACFDTAFHTTMPAAATTYAVPAAWRRKWDLRRYGFHGLSHAYASRHAAALAGRPGARVVSCHLGSGASLAAVAGGRSVDTTMGFTPLAGLVMGTRSGDVDPGLLIWLQRAGLALDDLEDGLEHRSGLAGLSEVGGDLRDVRKAADDGDERAVLALQVYVHRLRQGIAAMTASLGGIDVLVFTGGVGEHDAVLRAETAEGLAFLGIDLDTGRNTEAAADGRVSRDGSAVDVRVVEAREDVEIAAQTRALVNDTDRRKR
ncbi:acetate/propionate family kinase [Lentzea sp. NEAU-D7]|uniref:acetate/propionate family kinase n=1 Tax=Lentzea sp. NEAU-D7 TaxID=2994667 RepID=UPI00224AB0A9|nr:acetate/propionate family kinase [Lentzea sp. NEAU-D7]MCX2949120.1 acetate/propionate family kinase [Lentzea sp. NEAU-D7]